MLGKLQLVNSIRSNLLGKFYEFYQTLHSHVPALFPLIPTLHH